mgnify:CR=1 FL=1
MLKISNIKYRIVKDEVITYDMLIDFIYKYISKKYKVKNLCNVELVKKSLDARTSELVYILSAVFSCSNETSLLRYNDIAKYVTPKELTELKSLKIKRRIKVLVVGMGPSGLFNAYILNQAGFDVTLIDKGDKVEERVKKIDTFFEKGILDESSNIQFGEGGAGTFSDGKLGTNVDSPYIRFIFEKLVEFGANKDILYETKPHVGTDVLRNVIINIRKYLISSGVKVMFNTELIDFDKNSAKLIKNNDLTLGINNSWSGSCASGSIASAGVQDSRIDTLDDNGTPDIVIIYLGTNDCASAVEVSVFAEAIETIVAKVKALGVSDIFITTLGYSAYDNGKYTDANKVLYNAEIRRIAGEQNCGIVPLDDYIQDDSYMFYLGDNLHYNAKGAELLSKIYEKSIKEYFGVEFDEEIVVERKEKLPEGVIGKITATANSDFWGGYANNVFLADTTFVNPQFSYRVEIAKNDENIKGKSFLKSTSSIIFLPEYESLLLFVIYFNSILQGVNFVVL